MKGLGEDRDEYLMARVAHGQPELLERLLRRHAGPLLTFLRRMAGDRHASEELFQEVFLAVWRKRHQYEYPRPFKACQTRKPLDFKGFLHFALHQLPLENPARGCSRV
jgi:hypothetical protein